MISRLSVCESQYVGVEVRPNKTWTGLYFSLFLFFYIFSSSRPQRFASQYSYRPLKTQKSEDLSWLCLCCVAAFIYKEILHTNSIKEFQLAECEVEWCLAPRGEGISQLRPVWAEL